MDPNPPVKFPPLRPPPGAASQVRGLPTPAGYRHGMPLIGAPGPSLRVPRSERKRLWVWLGVAVGLHAVLLLVLFLTPPMRLKWGPPPEAWVPVVSLPKPIESPAPAAAPAASVAAAPLPANRPAPRKARGKPVVPASPATAPAPATATATAPTPP